MSRRANKALQPTSLPRLSFGVLSTALYQFRLHRYDMKGTAPLAEENYRDDSEARSKIKDTNEDSHQPR